jgi:hypothetical protein
MQCAVEGHAGYHPPPPQNHHDHDNYGHSSLHEVTPKHLGDCNVCHGIVCNEFNFTAWWHRAEFVGDEYDVALIDTTCNNFHQNRTAVWITSAFGTCGSAIVENKKFIAQKNTATLTVRNVTSNIAREHVYKYNLECLYARRNNASTGYQLVQGIKKTVDLNAESEFDISIDIYTSSSYLIKSGLPVTISMNQPIYVGIRKIHNNKHFKMIVEQCFATPTASVSGISYVFFQNKCGTDPSFKIVPTGDKDLFSFVITAFRFVEISKSIYMHCRAIMCQTTSRSSQCTQACQQSSTAIAASRRHRRRAHHDFSFQSSDILNNADVEEVQNITSKKIVFVEKRTCGDVACVRHSTCIDLYPAVCRCNPDYVYSSIEMTCVKDRVIKIDGLHVKSAWVRTYGDDSSVDFTRFATDSETHLMDAFQKLRITHVEGVKVMNARQQKGVATVDVSLLYKQYSSPEDILETFIKPFADQEPAFLLKLKKTMIGADVIPQIFQGTYAPGPKQPTKVKPTAGSVDTARKVEEDSSTVTQHVKKKDTGKGEVTAAVDKTSSGGSSNSTTTTVVGYFEQRTLMWVLLAVSLATVILVVGLVCHYKRTIYYHLMTW